MALVDNDFKPARLQTTKSMRLECNLFMLVGAGSMSIPAKWTSAKFFFFFLI
ncbi:transmembrane protein, putative [Medicago truncatula]|uniref:Transmembrane protein, putative n=1 Tax=Medicago truncatula TaxID=3880 RepID=G8A397_MEDTR|nr:transmembrane protein, putative [Medicago truncatula]